MTGAEFRTVTIGGDDVRIERFQWAKAVRIITLIGVIQKTVPEIQSEIAAFRRQYAEENVIVLDRAQARMRFGPMPLYDANDEPVVRDGEVVMMPSRLDQLSEADWEKSGNTLKLRQTPEAGEIIAAIFPTVMEKAELPVKRLLALVTMTNDDVARYAASGEIQERIDDVAKDRLSKAYLEEIMELAVVVGEMIEGQVMAKARELGGRLGNLRRLFGMETTPSGSSPATSTTSSEPPEQPSSSSSSDSESSSPGPTPTESPDSPGTSSTPSESTSLANAS